LFGVAKKTGMFSGIRNLLSHTLYSRLLVLLLCIVFSTILMQAGSLFIADYIPNIEDAIQKTGHQELLWKYRIDSASKVGVDSPENILRILDESAPDISDYGLKWLENQKDTPFRQLFDDLKMSRQRFHESLANDSLEMQLSAARAVQEDYGELVSALVHDMEIKQSVISLLQLVGMILVMFCVGAIALGARRVLVDRLDHLLLFAPSESVSDVERSGADEFVRLEKMVYETAARLEGFKAEAQWVNQTSGEQIRRLVRFQDFLFKFIELINNNILSEMTLRKTLYGLEKTLDVNNVALIFTENATVFAERVLFSHHWPAAMNRELLDDVAAIPMSFVSSGPDESNVRCLAVAFSSADGELGILKIEAGEDRDFDVSEKQLVAVTAQLLSMVMGFQSREQEGRRVALLEERAAIARELHDSLAQSLSYMKIQIARLQSNAVANGELNAVNDIVSELRGGLDSAYRELRELLATFRVHMDVRGLGSAIKTAIDEYAQRSSLSITLDNRLVNCRLTVNEEFHILHVVREALSNIVRHADASNVVIALVFQSNGSVMVTIDDDGVGYAPPRDDDPHHYGQAIMKERAYSLGGDIQVMTRRKGGTRVRLVFTPKLAQ